MKRSILAVGITIVLTTAFSAFVAHAQDATPSRKRVELGARFMPTFSTFNMISPSGSDINSDLTFGYGGGVFMGFNFTNHIGIQGEVLYFDLSQSHAEEDVERNVNLRYLNIPLLFSLNTGKSRRVNVNAVIGPQIGISVGSSLDISRGVEAQDAQSVLVVKRGDIGFAYGVGADVGLNPSKTFRLGIGFRGVYGLLDISDDSGTISEDSYYILDRTHLETYSAYIGLSILL